MPEEDLDTTRAAMLGWITSNWNELAAFAWRGFALDGRGIVVLQGDWQREVIVAYQTPGMVAALGLEWPPELHAAVQQYQPATEIVFLVQRGESGILLGMRTPHDQLPPRLAGQRDG